MILNFFRIFPPARSLNAGFLILQQTTLVFSIFDKFKNNSEYCSGSNSKNKIVSLLISLKLNHKFNDEQTVFSTNFFIFWYFLRDILNDNGILPIFFLKEILSQSVDSSLFSNHKSKIILSFSLYKFSSKTG